MVLTSDEGIRPNTTVETLAPLKAKAMQRLSGRRCCAAGLKHGELPCITIVDGQRNMLSSTQLRAETNWQENLFLACQP